MAGTIAMHNWWHTLRATERDDWCEVLTSDADVTESMAAGVDESHIGVVDLADNRLRWPLEWAEFWIVNGVTATERWLLNPDFLAFLEEQCDLL